MVETLIIIFILQVIYVTLVTIRYILTVKGYKYLSAPMSAIDIFVYMIGLKIVLANLNKPINLVVYCLGYAVGNFVGSKVEELLPLGYITLEVFTKKYDQVLAGKLRDQGYGVTVVPAEGMEGKSFIVSVITKKQNFKVLKEHIMQIAPDSLIVSYESRHLKGGFLDLYKTKQKI